MSYRNLSSAFQKFVDKHVPIEKSSKRKHCSFYESAIAKGNLCKIKAQKKVSKNPTAKNRIKRNKRVSIRKNAIKSHFKKATKNGVMFNKEFWDLVKPFLSNKGDVLIAILLLYIIMLSNSSPRLAKGKQ